MCAPSLFSYTLYTQETSIIYMFDINYHGVFIMKQYIVLTCIQQNTLYSTILNTGLARESTLKCNYINCDSNMCLKHDQAVQLLSHHDLFSIICNQRMSHRYILHSWCVTLHSPVLLMNKYPRFRLHMRWYFSYRFIDFQREHVGRLYVLREKLCF